MDRNSRGIPVIGLLFFCFEGVRGNAIDQFIT